MQELNEDRTRAITDEVAVFAVVGYLGEVRDGEFTGRHAGCFRTWDTARAWLRGEGEPDFLLDYSVAS